MSTTRATLSVTEVRNALRCPRVFALGRATRRAVAFPVGSSCLGAAFHRIVERFARTVGDPPAELRALPAGASKDAIRSATSRWLVDLLVDELEASTAYASMPAEVDDLAEALRELAGYLAERLAAFHEAPAAAMAKLVRSGEREVSATFQEAGVVLTGRVDALHGTTTGALEVVEYKLTDEANAPVDRAQVALYRELLRRGEGADARPVILRFGPALAVSDVTAESADALVRAELGPLLARMAGWALEPGSAPATPRRDLCAACPVAKACVETYGDRVPARDDPPACAARPRPTAEGGVTATAATATLADRPADTEGELEAGLLRDRILAELRRDGVSAEAKTVTVGPTVYVIPVSRPRGPVGHLDKAAADVIHRLAATDGVSLEYEKHGGKRHFIARRSRPRTVALAPLLGAKREWLAERPGRFVLGEEPGGDIVTGDLSDSATPHLLVAGNSGSGKSVLLKTIVASLVHFHGPAALRLTLLDPKRVTFLAGGFVGALGAHLDSPVLYGLEDAMPCFERFVDVMEERYALFQEAQVSDLHEYNDHVAEDRRLPRHVIVMDEFQDITAERKASQAFCSVVARLGAKARAAGVHLVLATQRPDRETVPPALKANLGGKIALRVSSAVNSRVILDAAGAERLLGKGDLYAELGKGLVRAQAAVI